MLCFAGALLLNQDPKQYVWVCQGVTVVDNMDDGEELLLTDVGRLWFSHVWIHSLFELFMPLLL